MSKWHFTQLPRAIRLDRRVAKLSDSSGMFWLMLLAQVDAYGRIGADIEILNADVWPLRHATDDAVETAVRELLGAGVLERHECGGQCWFQVVDWETSYGFHGRKDDRPQSAFPDPTRETLVTEDAPAATDGHGSEPADIDRHDAAPTSTGGHPPAPVATDHHDAAPTPTDRHAVAPDSTDEHDEPPPGTVSPRTRARVKLRVTGSEREREREGHDASARGAAGPVAHGSKRVNEPPGGLHPTSAHAEVIEYHAGLFVAAYGEPYMFADAKDGTAVKKMLKAAGGDAAAVKAKIDRAFADSWVRGKGCTIGLIHSQWSKLVEPRSSTAPPKPRDPNEPDWGGSDRQGREREVIQAWQTIVRGDPSVRPDLWRRAERVLERYGMHFPDAVPADAPQPLPWESGYKSRAAGEAS
ncbi:MAG: hypothetical protein Q8K82_14525 [Gemmatimonadaceae bacterium]|nr:hypothetical protein [Gemmatimonadaceae bacterium]